MPKAVFVIIYSVIAREQPQIHHLCLVPLLNCLYQSQNHDVEYSYYLEVGCYMCLIMV